MRVRRKSSSSQSSADTHSDHGLLCMERYYRDGYPRGSCIVTMASSVVKTDILARPCQHFDGTARSCGRGHAKLHLHLDQALTLNSAPMLQQLNDENGRWSSLTTLFLEKRSLLKTACQAFMYLVMPADMRHNDQRWRCWVPGSLEMGWSGYESRITYLLKHCKQTVQTLTVDMPTCNDTGQQYIGRVSAPLRHCEPKSK